MFFRHASFIAVCLVARRDLRVSPQNEQPTIRVSARAPRRPACPTRCGFAATPCRTCSNVLMCFGQHRDKISNRCRTVLASYGLQ